MKRRPDIRLIARASSSGRSILWVMVAVVLIAALGAFAAALLLVNIFEKKQEARNPFYRVVEIDDNTTDPAVWGKNFPYQYDQYQRTVDQIRTRYGGSEAQQRTPDKADERSVVAQSRLEEDPRLKTMWAGYSFAIDFREERGHAHMLEDQTFTERQKVGQPGTCLNCHASMYAAYKTLGDGDLVKGFEAINKMPYAEARKQVDHPVACIDCHDPETMSLRVTRPAFMEGIRKVKAAQGIDNYDVNTMATRQEMRAYVCGQCHVEYYFKGPEKRLTYPWDEGLKADQILVYYETSQADGSEWTGGGEAPLNTRFKDWEHAQTKAPALKAQHPEFEMWNQGIHARSGVACADCHMPYMRQGSLKISDHWVRSPLLNINNACQTCHDFPEEELKARAENIQTTTFNLRNMCMDALVELIQEISLEAAGGASEDVLNRARDSQRKAQFLLDFIEAENSMGFHASQEAARILATSMNHIRQGQNALRGLEARPAQTAPAPATMPSTTQPQ